ncbi:N-acyl-D-aspartate/D-glutamate deacylase [Microbacterium resistens]|uniref:N-acyl-D-aspartate/D-glutamate deacylase n=1 Tax=Microbacterium resistens TaxID=156977 RepID=A0ABU1S7U9_9MICO|nr:amidohydrolase family protein [Microbacterium resistens]MDR6865699.1 N-acyl-D-aspartate/D-glutamate deacylase [Microbacterium resistens]
MDTLLRGGRVIDPGTDRDAVADLLIADGRIAAIGADLAVPDDAEVVDAAGLVVGPGFIDLHSHVHSIAGHRLQAMDGVTTALDLEAGLMPVAEAIARASADGRPLNYGFSASWAQARALAHLDLAPVADLVAALGLLGDPEWQRSSSPAERRRWLAALEGELAAGAIGIGVLMGYAPRTDPTEYLEVARLAAAANAPTFTHVRELVEADPETPIDGTEELVRAAGETGAHMHHCHVNSTSLRRIDRVLGLLERTQAAGSRVTVEAYPYGAGSTGVGAYFLAPEKLAGLGITPQSIVLVDTGERIADVGRLREIRATDPGAPCIVTFLDEDDPADRAHLRRSLAYPDSIVASDAMPVAWPDPAGTRHDSREWPLPPGGRTHPRTAGTFAKSIRLMVRESGAWSWHEAFRRCAYLPARVLDAAAPSMRAKGHLGIGADADLVLIDPLSSTDTATYLDPTRPSAGVRHLFVGGTPVVRDGALLTDAYPGRAVRGEP